MSLALPSLIGTNNNAVPATTMAAASATHDTRPIQSLLCSKEDTLKAEILWCFRTINTHSSYKSNEETGALFRQMFPDSVIAKTYQCGERKSAYVTCFGIAPFLQSKLKKHVQEEQFYVMLFDESLNQKTQEKQLDFHVRLWDNNCVISHYYNSDFMGHAKAKDLLQSYIKCTDQLPRKGLLQLSMDGPNVNLKFHKEIQDELHRHQDCQNVSLINIGTCGLHVVHNAYKGGIDATGWKLDHLLFCLHQLFKDTPARRDDYTNALSSLASGPVFLLKFCKTRWIENVPVIKRAITVMSQIPVYVKAVNEGKFADPGTKSYEAVKEASKDPLTGPKLQFALSVAKQITPFLQFYQTDKPVLPFLAGDLFGLLQNIMSRFVKKEIMNEVKSIEKLLKVKVSDKDSHLVYSSVDVGFVTEKLLRDLLAKKSINESSVLDFRMKCKACLQAIVEKLLNKSPL